MHDDLALALRAVHGDDPVTPPPVDALYRTVGRRRRRRRALTVVGAALAATAVGLGSTALPDPAPAGELATGPQVLVPPANVWAALQGGTAQDPEPVALLARAELPGGRFLATVARDDGATDCLVTFVGPEGDGLVSSCGPRVVPDSRGVAITGGAVDVLAWVSGRTPPGARSVRCTDALGALDGPVTVGHFLLPTDRDRARLARTCVARDDAGREVARGEAPAGL